MTSADGRLAQLVEHALDVRRVSGSSPLSSTRKKAIHPDGLFCFISENPTPSHTASPGVGLLVPGGMGTTVPFGSVMAAGIITGFFSFPFAGYDV